VAAVLPPADLPLFQDVYDVTEAGNWEGRNILNRLSALTLRAPEEEARLAGCRARLLAVRERRVRPGFDDKVLADWNGLAISAIAEAALLLSRADWLDAATRAFRSILSTHYRDGTLHHSRRNGELRHLATAEGHANLIAAALALYAASADETFVRHAVDLADAAVRDHWDEAGGGFYFASAQARDLIVRARFAHDDATPNANAVMLANLARLWLLTGSERYRELAHGTVQAFAAAVAGNPFAHASFLSAFDLLTDAVEAVLVGDPASPDAAALRRAVLDLKAPLPLLHYVRSPDALQPGHPAYGKKATAPVTLYLCRGSRCALPVTGPAGVAAALASLD
jgi:uncharacterized protein YyaL (SSP411 family)